MLVLAVDDVGIGGGGGGGGRGGRGDVGVAAVGVFLLGVVGAAAVGVFLWVHVRHSSTCQASSVMHDVGGHITFLRRTTPYSGTWVSGPSAIRSQQREPDSTTDGTFYCVSP